MNNKTTHKDVESYYHITKDNYALYEERFKEGDLGYRGCLTFCRDSLILIDTMNKDLPWCGKDVFAYVDLMSIRDHIELILARLIIAADDTQKPREFEISFEQQTKVGEYFLYYYDLLVRWTRNHHV